MPIYSAFGLHLKDITPSQMHTTHKPTDTHAHPGTNARSQSFTSKSTTVRHEISLGQARLIKLEIHEIHQEITTLILNRHVIIRTAILTTLMATIIIKFCPIFCFRGRL